MSEAPSTTPVCYRHPKRETQLACNRCDRPICIDCKVDASVGFQCKECVKKGNKGVRPARTAFGGSRVGQLGYACQAIIAVNVLFLIASTILGGVGALFGAPGGWFGLLGSETPVTEWGEVFGYAYYQNGELHGIAHGEWYRLVTAMFINYGAVHMLLNMSLVTTLGRYLERQLGPVRFLALYLLSGLGGNVAAYVIQPQNQGSAGASTATYGLVIAAIVINKRLSLDAGPIIPLLITNVIFTLSVPQVSVPGHFGGLAAGAAAAAVLAYARVPHRTVKQAVGCSVVLAVILAAAIMRTVVLLS
ncbi:rhomboid family intramembrane serine protease [Actinoplanes italicus]|uniref:Membrane associated rhomboid family serine protease n=1 Tax=Actinoplanes italicus TaxID=113567 RepID=A0A2T0KBD2_9ACTN|nr:rhomboid family intramembrane serine protease [Actinoplanes italicus]PRX20503.1 membrane associated rhomboid family serine protease [Actinoplanes italicus]GIE31968.1 rhomboid family intramembrane serine protease [Actinoplanes italicus]